MPKPKLFIGSSVEGLNVAYAIQENLKFVTETTVWDQGVFNLSESSLESLIKVLEEADFGVFVFSPDDHIKIRGKKDLVVRDNVLFELGLFLGRLGRSRAFIIIPDNQEFHLPTDLIGMTPGKYETNRADGNIQAATGSACHKIRELIQKQGIFNLSTDAPENSNTSEVIKKNIEDDWVEALFIEKDYDKAITILKKRLRYTKDVDKKLNIKSQMCFIEAKRNTTQGILEYERVITENSNNNIPYIAYANYLIANNSYKKALEIIETGLSNCERKITLTSLKADCFWINNKKSEAIELLKNNLENIFDINMFIKLIDLYLEEKNIKPAFDLLHKAYLKYPNDETIIYKFARVSYDYNQKEISVLLYKELLSNYNESSTYWGLLGNTYLDLELHNLALVAYEKAAELSNHKESWIYDNLGNLYNNKQLYNKAEENLKKALQLYDKSDYTYNRLSSVYAAKQTENKKLEDIISIAKAKICLEEIG